MNSLPAVEISALSHSYGERHALVDLSLTILRGEIFAFLGPNGGGKTTLFRLLSTLIPVQCGETRILGHKLRTERDEIRRRIGVVFQAPSLDKKLTVLENIQHQAALYGLSGADLRRRSTEMLERLRLADRAHERTEKLSGGLRRRVEIAKGLIHRPQLLLLDEPSTGLDPGARSDLWLFLLELRAEHGTTIVLTTHLLEEADKAGRIAILDAGRLVALGAPDELRASVGGDSITIQTSEPQQLANEISARFSLHSTVVDGQVRLEQHDGHQWVPKLVDAFAGRIDSVTLGKPTLEDVFIEKTGHRFRARGEEVRVG